MPTLNEQRNLRLCLSDTPPPAFVQKIFPLPILRCKQLLTPKELRRKDRATIFHKVKYCQRILPAFAPSTNLNIGKHACVGSGLDHARQWGFPIGAKGFTKRLLLSRARRQYPNLPCRRNRFVAYRNALWRGFTGCYRAVNSWAGYHGFWFTRKKRSHVTVLAHAKENQVQHRLAIGIQRCNPANLSLGFASSESRRFFSSNAMDLIVRDSQWREQKLTSHTKVAFGVVWRHAAVISPEKVR